jgi:hypothetical protein
MIEMPGVRQSLGVVKQEGRRKSEEKAAGGTLGQNTSIVPRTRWRWK